MLTVFRGLITSPRVKADVHDFLKEHLIRKRQWKKLLNKKQLMKLRTKKQYIVADAGKGPLLTMIFMQCSLGDRITALDDGEHMTKIDLGSGLPVSLFKGTVFQVKYHRHTFHLCDVLLLKGEVPSDINNAFEDINTQVLPFFAHTHLYDFSDIPSLTALHRCLRFLSSQGEGFVWTNPHP